jgi:hypothetical protein
MSSETIVLVGTAHKRVFTRKLPHTSPQLIPYFPIPSYDSWLTKDDSGKSVNVELAILKSYLLCELRRLNILAISIQIG